MLQLEKGKRKEILVETIYTDILGSSISKSSFTVARQGNAFLGIKLSFLPFLLYLLLFVILHGHMLALLFFSFIDKRVY